LRKEVKRKKERDVDVFDNRARRRRRKRGMYVVK